MTITELALLLRRHADEITDEVNANTPDRHLPHPHLGYLSLAVQSLEIAAAVTAVEGMYVPDGELGEIDLLVAELAAQPVPA